MMMAAVVNNKCVQNNGENKQREREKTVEQTDSLTDSQ